jgi:hypothetical protein
MSWPEIPDYRREVEQAVRDLYDEERYWQAWAERDLDRRECLPDEGDEDEEDER